MFFCNKRVIFKFQHSMCRCIEIIIKKFKFSPETELSAFTLLVVAEEEVAAGVVMGATVSQAQVSNLTPTIF